MLIKFHPRGWDDCGPFKTHEEAMAARELMKRHAALNKYVGIPLVADSEKEAIKRTPFF